MMKSTLARFRELFANRPEVGALAAALAVFVIFSLWADHFLEASTLISVLTLTAEVGIVAMAITLLMIAGEFDLSVGSVWGLGAAVLTSTMNAGVPTPISVILVLIMGVAIGFLHGLIFIKVGVPTFVVTLAGWMFWRGTVYMATGAGFIELLREDPFLRVFSYQFPNGINISSVWFVGVAIILTLILQRTRFGNWAFATGGNKMAARQSGIPVNRVKFLLLGLVSASAALAGIIQTARFGMMGAQTGKEVMLEAYAAAAIGGNRLFGGYGSVAGTVLGVLMMAMIQNGLLLARVPAYWYQGVIGLLMVLAVIINTNAQKRALGMSVEIQGS